MPSGDLKKQEIDQDVLRANLITALFLKEEAERNARKSKKKAQRDTAFLFAAIKEVTKDIDQLTKEKDSLEAMTEVAQVLKTYREKLLALRNEVMECQSLINSIKGKVDERASLVLLTGQPEDAGVNCKKLVNKLQDMFHRQEKDKTRNTVTAADSFLTLIQRIEGMQRKLAEGQEAKKGIQESQIMLSKYHNAFLKFSEKKSKW